MRRLSAFILTLLALAAALPAAVTRADAPDAVTRDGWARMADLGEGFVVWESNRGGHWRIWRRNLDGSGLKQISPDEKGREHYCPHISPDGRRVAYLSFPPGIGYKGVKSKHVIPLHIVNADGGSDRVVIDNARRGEGGDRAVVWVDADRFHYLDKDGRARLFDMTTGKASDPLITNATGYLLSRDRRFAFDRYHYHPVDPKTGKLDKRGKKFGGCEPWVTFDGRWAIRMNGAGGPIDRVDLTTGKTHTIMSKNDDRMPSDRNYLYFPMTSADQRLLAFGASPDKHDHFKSDYDIFIAPIDPNSLELLGKPVRYTFHGKTDRYPDVYIADLPLGRHDGEAPLTVSFKPPTGVGEATWSTTGVNLKSARTLTHTFTEPGNHSVVAAVAGKTYRGRVTVRPAAPPRVAAAILADDRKIVLRFDEPVHTKDARFSLRSGINIADVALSDDGQTATLRLATKLTDDDALTIAAVTDRAQPPNAMKPQTLPIQPARWPGDAESLVFAFSTLNEPVRLFAAGGPQTIDLAARGLTHPNHDHALALKGGAYVADGAGKTITDRLRDTSELTIEATLRPANLKQVGPARIVSLSRNTSNRNFTLGQERDHLVMRLRTPKTGNNGSSPQINIARVSTDRFYHVAVTYKDGQMTGYLDGKQVMQTNDVRGDFGNWSNDMTLIFGDEASADRDWSGVLEGVAIYSKALDAETIQTHAAAYEALRAGRPSVDRAVVKAKLVARSDVPTLKQIAPYREALVTYEYEVTRVESGTLENQKIRVIHYAILDGQTLDIAKSKPGQSVTLTIEPFNANPQLSSLYLSDTLEENLDAKLFHAVME